MHLSSSHPVHPPACPLSPAHPGPVPDERTPIHSLSLPHIDARKTQRSLPTLCNRLSPCRGTDAATPAPVEPTHTPPSPMKSHELRIHVPPFSGHPPDAQALGPRGCPRPPRGGGGVCRIISKINCCTDGPFNAPFCVRDCEIRVDKRRQLELDGKASQDGVRTGCPRTLDVL